MIIVKQQGCFFNWVVQSLREKNPIYVVDDQINNPTWTQSMAEVIGLCVGKEISGIYHWGDAEFVSRYNCQMIANHYTLETELINSKSTEELGQVAPRPLKSGLLSDKIVEALKIKQPSINECLKQIILNNMKTLI